MVEIAFVGRSHPLFGLRFGEREILVTVIALLEEHGGGVGLCLRVVVQFVFIAESKVRPASVEKDSAPRHIVCLEREMRHEIVRLRFRRGGVLAARHVTPVLILVVQIVAARSVGHHRSVVVRLVIANVVEVHAGIACGGHFHFAVFVAGVENQVAAVFPKQHAAAYRRGANAEKGVVRAAVLRHDEFHLAACIAQRQAAEVGAQ